MASSAGGELTGRDAEPSELISFKVHRTQEPAAGDRDVHSDPVNRRRLGIRSALLLPLFNAEAVVTGVLGVFSERPSAFDDYDLATLQRMTDVIMAARRLSAPATAAIR